jgi:Family of unknown function (DUF5343)
MALPTSYLTTTKNLDAILTAIQGAQAPERFTQAFLESLEFKSTPDRLVIGVLKALSRKGARRIYGFTRIHAAGVTSISLATLVGSGIGSPNSRSVWRCPEIASRTFSSVSSKVLPVLTQPGRSGTYAPQFAFACSKMTAYFRFILSPYFAAGATGQFPS